MRAKIMLGIAAALMLVAPASAATITWGAAQDTSGAGDVLTSLATIEAVNLTSSGNVGSVVANGVTFTNDDSLMGLAGGSGMLAGANPGDPGGYNTLLDQLDHGDSSINNPWPIQVGGGNLVAGDSYDIQLWYTDRRGFAGPFTQNYSDGNGNTVNLVAGGANGFGQFVVGTFVADGTGSQTLEITGGGPPGEPHLNAYQIRGVGVPEPTTFLLGGLGLISLGFGTRRRHRAQS